MSLPTDSRGKAVSADTLSLNPGVTELLIVGPALTGYEYWKKEGGPVRQADVFDEPLPVEAKMEDEKDKEGNVIGQKQVKQKFYWAMPVYDFSTKTFEIWLITQKGLREELLQLQNNPNWGDPTGRYSVTVTKSGTGLQTKYKVDGNPSSFTSEEKKAELAAIMEKYKASPIDVAGDLFGQAE